MLARYLMLAMVLAHWLLAAPGAGLAANNPVAVASTPAHPRLLLTAADLERLRKQSLDRPGPWQRLVTWAQAPGRQDLLPQDAPGLALAALISKDAQPEQAQRLGRQAVACAQKIALVGRAQAVLKHQINDVHRPGAVDKLRHSSYHLLNTVNLQDNPWRIAQHTASGMSLNPADPPIDAALKIGETYLILLDDLNQADEAVSLASLTLDWAWDFFTPQERQDLGAWLAAQAKVFANRPFGCFTGDSVRLLRMQALAGLAAQGLHPQAEALAQRARRTGFEQEILPCLRQAGAGGAWFEGSAAGAQAGLYLLEFVAAWKSATGEDLQDSAPWFKDRLAYLMHHQPPGVANSPRGGYRLMDPDGDQIIDAQEASDLTRMQMLLLLALRPQHEFAGWAWVEIMDRAAAVPLSDHRLVYEYLWFNNDPPVRALSTAPLSYLAPGAGRAFLRSDWSPLSTWLSFHCGPHFAANQHLDAGSLVIHRQGALLPPGGVHDGPTTQHAQNYAARGLAHNTVQVLDAQEYSWLDMREGPQRPGTYANDGGQRSQELHDGNGRLIKQAPWTASGWEVGPAPFSQLKEVYQVAQVEALEEKPRFAYLRGNATAAYQGSTHKVSRLVRHVFYLRPGGTDDSESAEAVAVMDDVALNHERASVSFLLHGVNQPQVSGQGTNLGPGRQQFDENRLRIQEGPSRLDVICLLPHKARIKIYGQAGQADSWVGDRNYPPRPPFKNPAPFRAEIGAAQASGKSRPMINVLMPADSGAPEPVEIAALAASDDNIIGLVIKDRLWPRVLALRLGEPQESASVTYEYQGGASRHLVAGLMPNRSYNVAVSAGRVTLSPSGGPGEPLMSSAAGTLAFKVPNPDAGS